jgi:hypothetical protein
MFGRLSAPERRSIALFFAAACLGLSAWAFPNMTRLLTIPGAILCFAGAIWFLWPEIATFVNARLPARFQFQIDKKPWKHTLEDLFASDFSDLGCQERKMEMTIRVQPSPSEPIKFTMRFRLHPDFRSSTEFVSIFIPVTNIATHDSQIVRLLALLPKSIKESREQMHNDVGIGMSAPGMIYQDSKSLLFSGRVFVYTTQPFTMREMGELAGIYEGEGLRLEIRGHDYWWANRDR